MLLMLLWPMTMAVLSISSPALASVRRITRVNLMNKSCNTKEICCYIPPHTSTQRHNEYTHAKSWRAFHGRFRSIQGPILNNILHPQLMIAEQQQSTFNSNIDFEPPTSIDLADIIRESYSIGETDGVQDALAANNILSKLSNDFTAKEVANQLVSAAMDAAGKNRGSLAAIINAILASCCGSDDNKNCEPQVALAMLDIVDEMHSKDETSMVAPDIVFLALVYYALSHQDGFESECESILDRAQRYAKKMAGSQRRKELAAERRKGASVTNNGMDTEGNLQSLYGPDIHILHETDDVIVISKPAGMVCYHSKKTGAGKITNSRKKKSREGSSNKGGQKQIDISLVDALLDSSIPLSTLNPVARGIVHRIDRGTSGAIILAKTDEIHLNLVAQFFLRRVKKKYLALVHGSHKDNSENGDGSSTEPSDSTPLTLDSTGVIDADVDGRPARSTYRVVKIFEDEQSSILEAILLEVETLTGRKHQVRVHCASLGHPIFLDPLYSSTTTEKKAKPLEKKNTKKNKKNESSADNISEKVTQILPQAIFDLLDNSNHKEEQFFLHAATLSVPELGISVDAPLPKWWVDTTNQLVSS